MIAQPRDHDENSPEPENHARDGGQHFHQGDQRLANPEWRQFGEVNCGRDAQRHRDNQRDERRNKRSVDKRQRAELFRHRIPGRGDEETEIQTV